MRTALHALAIALVATFGVAAGLLLVLLAKGFFHFEDRRQDLPPCFEVGAPYHHRFRPGCSGIMSTPDEAVSIDINEDGLRDLPRAEIVPLPSRILLMGDSFVEGWWVSPEQTLGAALRQRFPGHYFINGGLRSTGPAFQAVRLKKLLEIYKPSAVLWFLNDTDGLDERLTCAITRDPGVKLEERIFETPELEISGWKTFPVRWLGEGGLGRRLRLFYYEQKWKELVDSDLSKRCGTCDGVEDFSGVAKAAGVPVLAYYVITSRPPLVGHYVGGEKLREQVVQCVEKAGFTFRRLSMEFPEPEGSRYYLKDDFHLSPAGLDLLASRISSDVGKLVRANSGKAGGRKR